MADIGPEVCAGFLVVGTGACPPGAGSCHSGGQDLVSSVQLCATLCDPVDGSTPGFHVHHQLPGLAQTHVHQVRDAIQLIIGWHPLASPSPPAFNLSQRQGLSQ